MNRQGKNYTSNELGPFSGLDQHSFKGIPGKHFIGGNLGLSGCEVSVNKLPAGVGMPFVHAHKKNEELYIVLGGNGTFYADGDEFPLGEGSLVRVAPDGARAITAGSEDLYFICVQAEAGSLKKATWNDGYRLPETASWMTA